MANTILHLINYFPLGLGAGLDAGFDGGLLPLLPPEGFPVVLGAFTGLPDVFAIIKWIRCPTLLAFRICPRKLACADQACF